MLSRILCKVLSYIIITTFVSCTTENLPTTYQTVGTSYLPLDKRNVFTLTRTTISSNASVLTTDTIVYKCDTMATKFTFRNQINNNNLILARDAETFVLYLNEYERFHIALTSDSSRVILGYGRPDGNYILSLCELTYYTSETKYGYKDGTVVKVNTLKSKKIKGITYNDVCMVDAVFSYEISAVRRITFYFAKGVGLIARDWSMDNGMYGYDELISASLH